MRTKRSVLAGRITLLALFVMSAPALFASGPVEQMIYNFNINNDGRQTSNGLVADAAGNLYGVTTRGGIGANTNGAVFELSPPATAGGAWSEAVLYSFGTAFGDGAYPDGTLIIDQLGNLYGTTTQGGSIGLGTVFELSPPATPGGSWTETVLYSYPDTYQNGRNPSGKLALDPAGNLYGTTLYGGIGTHCSQSGGAGCGTVYKLSPPATAGGAWTHTILHNFGVGAFDGTLPTVSGVLYRGGALYGATQAGGVNGEGTVFVLVPTSSGYIEHRLHDFAAVEGGGPTGGLIVDSSGNFYGTTLWGGGSANCQGGCGSIFELSPPAAAGGAWTLAQLYAFTDRLDGASPWASLYRDQSGSLYGTASQGGITNRLTSNNGVAFRLKPPAVTGGTWTLVPLHEFKGPNADGTRPYGELILLNHVFYGTISAGAGNQEGGVFSIAP